MISGILSSLMSHHSRKIWMLLFVVSTIKRQLIQDAIHAIECYAHCVWWDTHIMGVIRLWSTQRVRLLKIPILWLVKQK